MEGKKIKNKALALVMAMSMVFQTVAPAVAYAADTEQPAYETVMNNGLDKFFSDSLNYDELPKGVYKPDEQTLDFSGYDFNYFNGVFYVKDLITKVKFGNVKNFKGLKLVYTENTDYPKERLDMFFDDVEELNLNISKTYENYVNDDSAENVYIHGVKSSSLKSLDSDYDTRRTYSYIYTEPDVYFNNMEYLKMNRDVFVTESGSHNVKVTLPYEMRNVDFYYLKGNTVEQAEDTSERGIINFYNYDTKEKILTLDGFKDEADIAYKMGSNELFKLDAKNNYAYSINAKEVYVDGELYSDNVDLAGFDYKKIPYMTKKSQVDIYLKKIDTTDTETQKNNVLIDDYPLPFKTVYEKTTDLKVGESKIKQKGKKGVARAVVDYSSGEIENPRIQEVLTDPVDKVVLVGAEDKKEDTKLFHIDLKEKRKLADYKYEFTMNMSASYLKEKKYQNLYAVIETDPEIVAGYVMFKNGEVKTKRIEDEKGNDTGKTKVTFKPIKDDFSYGFDFSLLASNEFYNNSLTTPIKVTLYAEDGEELDKSEVLYMETNKNNVSHNMYTKRFVDYSKVDDSAFIFGGYGNKNDSVITKPYPVEVIPFLKNRMNNFNYFGDKEFYNGGFEYFERERRGKIVKIFGDEYERKLPLEKVDVKVRIPEYIAYDKTKNKTYKKKAEFDKTRSEDWKVSEDGNYVTITRDLKNKSFFNAFYLDYEPEPIKDNQYPGSYYMKEFPHFLFPDALTYSRVDVDYEITEHFKENKNVYEKTRTNKYTSCFSFIDNKDEGELVDKRVDSPYYTGENVYGRKVDPYFFDYLDPKLKIERNADYKWTLTAKNKKSSGYNIESFNRIKFSDYKLDKRMKFTGVQVPMIDGNEVVNVRMYDDEKNLIYEYNAAPDERVDIPINIQEKVDKVDIIVSGIKVAQDDYIDAYVYTRLKDPSQDFGFWTSFKNTANFKFYYEYTKEEKREVKEDLPDEKEEEDDSIKLESYDINTPRHYKIYDYNDKLNGKNKFSLQKESFVNKYINNSEIQSTDIGDLTGNITVQDTSGFYNIKNKALNNPYYSEFKSQREIDGKPLNFLPSNSNVISVKVGDEEFNITNWRNLTALSKTYSVKDNIDLSAEFKAGSDSTNFVIDKTVNQMVKEAAEKYGIPYNDNLRYKLYVDFVRHNGDEINLVTHLYNIHLRVYPVLEGIESAKNSSFDIYVKNTKTGQKEIKRMDKNTPVSFKGLDLKNGGYVWGIEKAYKSNGEENTFLDKIVDKPSFKENTRFGNVEFSLSDTKNGINVKAYLSDFGSPSVPFNDYIGSDLLLELEGTDLKKVIKNDGDLIVKKERRDGTPYWNYKDKYINIGDVFRDISLEDYVKQNDNLITFKLSHITKDGQVIEGGMVHEYKIEQRQLKQLAEYGHKAKLNVEQINLATDSYKAEKMRIKGNVVTEDTLEPRMELEFFRKDYLASSGNEKKDVQTYTVKRGEKQTFEIPSILLSPRGVGTEFEGKFITYTVNNFNKDKAPRETVEQVMDMEKVAKMIKRDYPDLLYDPEGTLTFDLSFEDDGIYLALRRVNNTYTDFENLKKAGEWEPYFGEDGKLYEKRYITITDNISVDSSETLNMLPLKAGMKGYVAATPSFNELSIYGKNGSSAFGYDSFIPTWYELKNLKIVSLLPEGTKLEDYHYTPSPDVFTNEKFEVIENYMNTGRTALMLTADTAKVPESMIKRKGDDPKARLTFLGTEWSVLPGKIKDKYISDIYTTYDGINQLSKYEKYEDNKVDKIFEDENVKYYWHDSAETVVNSATGVVGSNFIRRNNDDKFELVKEVDYKEEDKNYQYYIAETNLTKNPVSNLQLINFFPYVNDDNIIKDGKRGSGFRPILESVEKLSDDIDVKYLVLPESKVKEIKENNKYDSLITDYDWVDNIPEQKEGEVLLMRIFTKDGKVVKPNDSVGVYANMSIKENIDTLVGLFAVNSFIRKDSSTGGKWIEGSPAKLGVVRNITVKFKKVDEEGKPLEGAGFKINDEEVHYSDKEGYVVIKTKYQDKMILSESEVPEGYVGIEDINLKDKIKDEDIIDLGNIVNKTKGNPAKIKIVKNFVVPDDIKEVRDLDFRITDDNGLGVEGQDVLFKQISPRDDEEYLIEKLKTDSNGVVVAKEVDVTYGATYIFEYNGKKYEVKTPDLFAFIYGGQKPPVKFEVEYDGKKETVELNSDNDYEHIFDVKDYNTFKIKEVSDNNMWNVSYSKLEDDMYKEGMKNMEITNILKDFNIVTPKATVPFVPKTGITSFK